MGNNRRIQHRNNVLFFRYHYEYIVKIKQNTIDWLNAIAILKTTTAFVNTDTFVRIHRISLILRKSLCSIYALWQNKQQIATTKINNIHTHTHIQTISHSLYSHPKQQPNEQEETANSLSLSYLNKNLTNNCKCVDTTASVCMDGGAHKSRCLTVRGFSYLSLVVAVTTPNSHRNCKSLTKKK